MNYPLDRCNLRMVYVSMLNEVLAELATFRTICNLATRAIYVKYTVRPFSHLFSNSEAPRGSFALYQRSDSTYTHHNTSLVAVDFNDAQPLVTVAATNLHTLDPTAA